MTAPRRHFLFWEGLPDCDRGRRVYIPTKPT
jgi:hypothetical protein